MKHISIIVALSIIFLLSSCCEKKGLDHNTANFSTVKKAPKEKQIPWIIVDSMPENKWMWTGPEELVIDNFGNTYIIGWGYVESYSRIVHYGKFSYTPRTMKIKRIGQKYIIDITHCKNSNWHRYTQSFIRQQNYNKILRNVSKIIR